MEEQEQQKILFELSMLEQQISQLQQQIQSIEKAILELNSLNFDLESLKGKKEKEIYAPVGKGIFVKAKLISENLLINIGEKNLVKKTIPETKDILKEQIRKLSDIELELNKNLKDAEIKIETLIEKSRNKDK